MNYYFVKDGQLIAGKINATNPKESTIMGARVIEARDLTITGDYTMLVPYVYVELKDAINRARMWTKEKGQVLRLYTNEKPKFALIDNRALPVRIKETVIDDDGVSFSCQYLNENDELANITVHGDELYFDTINVFEALTKSLC